MYKRSSILAGVMFVSCLSFGKAGMNYINQKQERAAESATIPPEINKIFQNSCFDCHTPGGKKMAMNHVNFSEWDKYSADKKAKKSADIVRMLNKGSMPPKLYRQSHPDKIPNAEQVTLISEWAETLKVK